MFQGFHLEEIILIQKGTKNPASIRMLDISWFKIIRNQKLHKYATMRKWKIKKWDIFSTEYHEALKIIVIRYKSHTRNWFYKLRYIYAMDYLATIKHDVVKEYLFMWENTQRYFLGNESGLWDSTKPCTQMWKNTETSDFPWGGHIGNFLCTFIYGYSIL